LSSSPHRLPPVVCRAMPDFSVYCSVYPRDLHSFPTRRSSDLEHVYENTSIGRNGPVKIQDIGKIVGLHNDPPGHGAVDFPGSTRSEEHTSELQSRENLVCRLLLEKKNRNRGQGLQQRVSLPEA